MIYLSNSLLICLMILFSGCLFERQLLTITGLPKDEMASVLVTEVKLENNQLVITGSNLNYVENLSLKKTGFEAPFTVVEKNGTTLKANQSSEISIPLDELLDLVLSKANATSVIPVQFTLPDMNASDGEVLTYDLSLGKWVPQTPLVLGEKTVELKHLSSMGADEGDMLMYNRSQDTWEALPLNISGLTYKGGHDPADHSIDSIGNDGDYFIATTTCNTGCVGGETYLPGDFMVYISGTGWQKISGEKGVKSFFGAFGDIDETSNLSAFKLNNIGDVDIDVILNPPSNEDLLIFNNVTGTWSNQDFASTTFGSDILTDISANTDAINSLSTALDSKQDAPPLGGTSNHYLKGDQSWGVFADDMLGVNLTGYTMAGGAQSIDATDTINTALGKLEYKVDHVNTSVTSVTAGNGLSNSGTSSDVDLAVNVDNSSLEINSNSLRIKPSGIGDSHINSISISKVSGLQAALDGKQGTHANISTLTSATLTNTEFLKMDGSGNLETTSLINTNTGLGSSDSEVPSQNAVKTYVDNAISGSGIGDFLADGSVHMDSSITFDDVDKSNTASLQSPTDITTNYTLTLPNSAPSGADEFLKSDASGNLSWVELSSKQDTLSGTTDITTGNITIDNAQSLKFLESSGNGTNYVELRAPSSLGSNLTYTLPGSAGSNGYILSTNGLGTLSWVAAATGTVTGVTAGNGLTATGTAAVELAVNVDNSTLEINSNNLRIKSLGITDSHISNTANIAISKISGLQTALDGKQSSDAQLTDVAGLTPGDGAFIIGNGTNFITESGTTAKTSIGLGNVDNIQQMPLSYLDNTLTLGYDTDKVPSQNAVKTYVDSVAISKFLTKNSNYTVTDTDYNALIIASGANTVITLPNAATAGTGFKVTVKRVDASNKIAIDAPNPIDDRDQIFYYDNYTSTTFLSNGTQWYITDVYGSTSPILNDAPTTCPSNFIPVPGNSELGTTGFCVAKYEMRGTSGNLSLDPAEYPYVEINANNSYSECANITTEFGMDSGTYQLITNAQWMTIARNLEQVASNWSGGSVGSGMIPRGHTDANPGSVLNISSTIDPYIGTGNDAGSGWEQKRTLTLSNDEIIWDFAGNVWEWVDWTGGDGAFTPTVTTCPASWNEFNVTCSDLSADEFLPQGGYTSSENMGMWYGGSGGAARRGGDWGGGGAFALYLYGSASNAGTNSGLRCSWQP